MGGWENRGDQEGKGNALRERQVGRDNGRRKGGKKGQKGIKLNLCTKRLVSKVLGCNPAYCPAFRCIHLYA